MILSLKLKEDFTESEVSMENQTMEKKMLYRVSFWVRTSQGDMEAMKMWLVFSHGLQPLFHLSLKAEMLEKSQII